MGQERAKTANKACRKVLAVASGGGHWEQLMLLRETLEAYDVAFATTDAKIAAQRGLADADILPDCNQNTPIKALLCALVAAKIILKRRPISALSPLAHLRRLAHGLGRIVIRSMGLSSHA